jgi:aminotransferase
VSQFAALGALQGSQKCIDQYKNQYEAARNLMCERLDRIPHIFSYIRPQGSYLMFPKIETNNNDSFAFCVDLLQNARVSTTPGVAFGPNGEGHVRMSFCVPLETINKAFDRIETYFKPPA